VSSAVCSCVYTAARWEAWDDDREFGGLLLPEEAVWLGERIAARSDEDLYPLVNLGSSTEEYLSMQPWIRDEILSRLTGAVINVDLKDEPGVDIVGDILDPEVKRQILECEPRSILCSNMLEHVIDPERVTNLIVDLVSSGGLIIVSGPYRFPKHDDPIDNGLRTTALELAALFPGTRLVEGAIVDCGTFWRLRPAKDRTAAVLVARVARRGRDWGTTFRNVYWWPRRVKAACAILQKL
jgi:hypothetical protein